MLQLNTADFFKYFILHPESDLLSSEDRTRALASSIILGILTFGLIHAVCFLVFRSYKPLPSDPRTWGLFQQVHPPGSPHKAPQLLAEEMKEGEFWAAYYGPDHPELALFLQKAFLKAQEGVAGDGKVNYDDLAEELITRYLQVKKGISLSAEERTKFAVSIAYNMQYWGAESKKMEPPPSHVVAEMSLRTCLELNDGNALLVYYTTGEGSCGFHALLGSAGTGGECHLANVTEARKEFCNYLRQKRREGALPPQIEAILVDHFLYFVHAPGPFQRAVREIRDGYYAGYQQATPLEQDAKKAAFLANDTVFEAYLAHFAEVGTYLLQPEVMSAIG